MGILAGSRRQLQVCGLPSVKRFVRKLRGVRSPEARVITLWYYSRVLTVDRKIFDRRFSRLNYCVRVQWCALCSSIVHALPKEAAAVVL